MRSLRLGNGIGLTWSPDSRWIAYSEAGSLYKILANGDSLMRLTTSANDFRPSWSPNGASIAFVRSGLKTFGVQSGQVADVLLYGDFPSWHPNGTQIVFLRSLSSGGGSWFYEFDAVTVSSGQITVYHSFNASTDCGFSAINSTAKDIVFSSRPVDGTAYTQIIRFNIAALSLTQITTDGGDYPAWSPDGNRIVYTRTAKGDGGLWIMNADGSGKRRLTTP